MHLSLAFLSVLVVPSWSLEVSTLEDTQYPLGLDLLNAVKEEDTDMDCEEIWKETTTLCESGFVQYRVGCKNSYKEYAQCNKEEGLQEQQLYVKTWPGEYPTEAELMQMGDLFTGNIKLHPCYEYRLTSD